MSEKIPRDEIKTAESILKKIASHMNKDLLVMICGSYRRGRDKSGDVDCLIAHPLIKTKIMNVIIAIIVLSLNAPILFIYIIINIINIIIYKGIKIKYYTICLLIKNFC